MLGNESSGGIEGHGDAIGALLDQIKERARLSDGGGNGNGAGNGNGGHSGGGSGDDPFDAPVSVRMLLDAARVIAEAMVKVGGMNLEATKLLSDKTIEVVRLTRDAGQENLIDLGRQLHANSMSLAEATRARIERVEDRVLAIEAHLGGRPARSATGAGDDVGSGP